MLTQHLRVVAPYISDRTLLLIEDEIKQLKELVIFVVVSCLKNLLCRGIQLIRRSREQKHARLLVGVVVVLLQKPLGEYLRLRILLAIYQKSKTLELVHDYQVRIQHGGAFLGKYLPELPYAVI